MEIEGVVGVAEDRLGYDGGLYHYWLLKTLGHVRFDMSMNAESLIHAAGLTSTDLERV